MTEEMKLKLFEKMFELEHKSEIQTERNLDKLYDGIDYFSKSDGAFEMLIILGLHREYIRWSYGK